KRLHKIEKNLSLLEGLGLRTTREGVSLPFLKEDDEYVAAQLVRNAEYGMRNCKLRTANSAIRTQPLVVIHAGTSDFGAYKRWPAASYAQLADKVVEELNAYVVFTWESSELEMVKEIISVMRHPGHLAPKTETLGQLASLIRRADLFISGDTGPMHIASALGVPQVAIFGPKDPIIYGPYQKNAVVVRKELDCSPCTKRTCNNPICITSITPGEVFGAARALLR
ncbi:MAG TPA: glycosyltransferase family 9 protein, partial [Candidatus Hypogeohydataceae bacterium YC40]